MEEYKIKLVENKSIRIGDLIIEDSGGFGIDISHVDGRKLCFINEQGSFELLRFLKDKHRSFEKYA